MQMEPFESAANLSEDMGMFEAAMHPHSLTLERPPLQSIVVALDGSNQDPTAQAFGSALATATGARVFVRPFTTTTDAAAILRTCAEQQAHLLLVPVPFGSDIGILKDESLGSVVDMLLLESKCPVLCVREVFSPAEVQAALADVLVCVTGEDTSAVRALAWAFRVVQKGGRIELLAVADRDMVDQAKTLLGQTVDASALEADALNRAITQDVSGLVASLQKQAREERLTGHIEYRVGRLVEVALQEANQRPRLIVVGTPRDHTTPAFHHAADLVLGARGPVLIVGVER